MVAAEISGGAHAPPRFPKVLFHVVTCHRKKAVWRGKWGMFHGSCLPLSRNGCSCFNDVVVISQMVSQHPLMSQSPDFQQWMLETKNTIWVRGWDQNRGLALNKDYILFVDFQSKSLGSHCHVVQCGIGIGKKGICNLRLQVLLLEVMYFTSSSEPDLF